MNAAANGEQRLQVWFQSVRALLSLAVLSFISIFIHGYHLGHQDQAVWLAAVKKSLDPGLYPFDSAFFLAQTQYSLFPQLVAWSVRATHWPLDRVIFLWHLLSIFVVLLATWEIARRVFRTSAGIWGAVATVWAARLLVAGGSKVNLTDRYLHPRDLAVAAILVAFVEILDGKLRAVLWIVLAALMHPTMAVIGALHLAIQAWRVPRPQTFALTAAFAMAPIMLLALGPVPNPVWREVVASRSFLLPLHWHWYEWLGVVGPMAMLLWYAKVGERRELPLVAHISRRVALAGALGVVGALLISTLPALERFIPTEPMRVLHFVYFCWVFLSGGLLGEYVLRRSAIRWFAFLAPIVLAFAVGQAFKYPASPQVEWPGRLPANDWVRAFDWARLNTPRGALFALNPYTMSLPGNDSHGFRALAERGALADGLKDRAVTANCPELAYQWRQEMKDQENWQNFGAADFARLARRYGVSWVVLERASQAGSSAMAAYEAGLHCPYLNKSLMVCEVRRPEQR
jgi:hypothetical protein